MADYRQIIQIIEQRTLDPKEDRHSDLLELLRSGLSSLPKPNRLDAYLGAALVEAPDVDSWEYLPSAPADRVNVLEGALSFLHGQPRWHATTVMHNVNPPPLIESVAASTIVSMYNPNMLWDFVSAGGQAMERQVYRQIGRFVGWDAEQPDGVFTFGGKGCLTYAVRIGLNRCLPRISSKGLSGAKPPVVLTSKANHYSIESVCSLLGLGSSGCIRLPTLENDTIDLAIFEATLTELMSSGTPIACIIASGGNTLNMAVDDLAEVRRVVDEVVVKTKANYTPFLYFDAVVGWPWMVFKGYDWQRNLLKFPTKVCDRLIALDQKFAQTVHCDAIGCDYHKTGLAPYLSSSFVIRNAAELHAIFKDQVVETKRQPHGNNFQQHHTIEHSRGLTSCVTAWVALQSVGIDGLRSYLARMTEIGIAFQEQLTKYGLEHINTQGLGFAGVYWASSGGPKTYAELLKTSPQEIEANNRCLFALFDQLALPDDGQHALMLRYLPQYRSADNGLPAATFVIYPMALATSDEMVVSFSRRIGEMAARLHEFRSASRPFRFAPPNHVPK